MAHRLFTLALLLLLLSGCGHKQPTGETVYVTRTGVRYHVESCDSLRSSKRAISLKDAKADSYTPCLRCEPPQ